MKRLGSKAQLDLLNSDAKNNRNNFLKDENNIQANTQMRCAIARSIFNYISLMYSFVS